MPSRRRPQSRDEPVWVSEPGLRWEEYQKLLRGLDLTTSIGKRDAIVVLAPGEMGLRLEEMAGLRLGDVNLSDRTVFVEIAKLSQKRRLPISDLFAHAWTEHVRDYAKALGFPNIDPMNVPDEIKSHFAIVSTNGKPFFIAEADGGMRADAKALGDILDKTARAAGVQEQYGSGARSRKINFDRLRETFSQMMRKGLENHPKYRLSEMGGDDD